MRDKCEKCGCALAATGDACICTYECTFCVSCTESMDGVCPNCGGELVRRPKKKSE